MPRLKVDPDTWAQLEALLDAALDQPAAERDRWIETLAPEHARLIPRLRQLLSDADGDGTDMLRTLPKFALDEADFEEVASGGDRPGDLIGPYRLVRELGSGGMGAVWLAERSDGLVNRPVALKLPHQVWRSAVLAERMARERDILAALAHPNIARLYDAGLTAENRPFLAIEYVDGRPIDEYCDQRQLDTRARVALFAQVAHAVAYAHAKLVVHRDLKPANILVTTDGQVRLLDFGVAKLLQDRDVPGKALTEVSGVALTPDYASPEQICGAPLTIGSDVYSLGVVLYELLSGARPYRLKRDSRGALEDAILAADPPPPSDVVEPTRRRAVRGDLDTIALKALKKRPEERYVTVHALLDDIERYLDGRPVLARSDSVAYRIRKFTRRHAIPVAAAGAVLLALLVGAGVAAWQARVALGAQRRAEDVKELIASVFREADPTQGPGQVLTAADLLRQAERRLHDRTDVEARTQVELLAIIGESLFGLQENADAARVAEQALRLQASVPGADGLLTARLRLVLSQAYELLGKHQDAARELDRSFAAMQTSGGASSGLFVQAKLQQAALGIVLADYGGAEQAALEAIRLASSTMSARSSEAAVGLQQLSHVYTLTQRRELAVEPARQAFEILHEVHAAGLGHPKVMESGLYYATALNVVGEFEKAFDLYRDVLANASRVFGDDSRIAGESLSAMVPLEIEIGELEPAAAHARQAIDIYLKEGQPGSAVHAGRVRKLESALLAARMNDDAANRLDEAVRLAVVAKSELEAQHARGSFGLALAYSGRFDEADRQLRTVIDQRGAAPRARHLAMRNLGTSLRLQGRHREALEWLDKGLEASALQRSHRGDHAHGLVEAGLARLELGDVEIASELFARAAALFDDVQKQRMTPARVDLLVGTARAQIVRGDYAAALGALERADAFWRALDPENRSAGEAALWLGRCYRAMRREAEARAALDRARPVLARSPLASDRLALR